MSYLYETHMHTCQGSACGRSSGKDHVHFYLDQGYTGMIITDHFFGGNTAVPRNLPWEQRIDLFFRGYEEALEEGLRVGLDVFFGLEQNFSGDEYLIYGLDKEYMKAHPEMERWTRQEQLEEVHRAGGAVIQAHPFRLRDYIDFIRIGDLFADGIEGANAGNDPLDDARAIAYGRRHGLLMTAGSDNHFSPAPLVFGVELDHKLESIGDYARLIRQGGPVRMHIPNGRDQMPAWKMDERHMAWRLNAAEKPEPLEDGPWNFRGS